MGDINTDIQRLCKTCKTDSDLSVACNKFPCDFTYKRSQKRNNRSNVYYSPIDLFLIRENVYKKL